MNNHERNPLVWFLSSITERSETGQYYIINNHERNPLNLSESLQFDSDSERIPLVLKSISFSSSCTSRYAKRNENNLSRGSEEISIKTFSRNICVPENDFSLRRRSRNLKTSQVLSPYTTRSRNSKTSRVFSVHITLKKLLKSNRSQVILVLCSVEETLDRKSLVYLDIIIVESLRYQNVFLPQ